MIIQYRRERVFFEIHTRNRKRVFFLGVHKASCGVRLKHYKMLTIAAEIDRAGLHHAALRNSDQLRTGEPRSKAFILNCKTLVLQS
jgi:hypothetical protein